MPTSAGLHHLQAFARIVALQMLQLTVIYTTGGASRLRLKQSHSLNKSLNK